jgi:allantoinase
MDKVIAGALVVTETDTRPMHICIDGGRIVGLVDAAAPVPQAASVVDGTGLIAVPGAIDAHTHFTGAHDDLAPEIEAGTRGAAKAGVTTVIEMPHSNPPATTLERYLGKQKLMADNAVVDFALWGGIDGENLGEIQKMHAAGAAAMKGFMCSGRPDGGAGDERGLPMLNDDHLLEAMRVIADLDGVIGLHAENHFIIQGRQKALRAAGADGGKAHGASQPEIAETEAIARAIYLAQQTGVHLHVVHLSSPAGADLITAAQATDKVTVETCPQYLVLDEDDLERMGAIARCGPPIRPRATGDALWERVLSGKIDALTSDHCPYPIALKSDPSIWNAAMGLTGIETTVPLFFSAATERGLSLGAFAQMTATAPAKIFGLYGRKGAIAVGFDADIVLIDPDAESRVDAASFEGQAKWSPFDGMPYRGRVVETLVRGQAVYRDGAVTGLPGGGEYIARLAH